MAVNTQKLLPASRSGALSLKTSKITISSKQDKKKGGALVQSQEGGLSKEILQMKVKVLKLQGSIEKNNKENQKEQEGKRKIKEKEEKATREKKLETKTKGLSIPKIAPNLPGGSILDTIKRYLGFTFLGWLVGKYEQLMPQLEKFMSTAKPIFDGLVFVVDSVIKGVFGFVDTGYKVYDTINSGIKKLGGENAEKTFNDFSGHLNKLLNGAIIAAMLLVSTAPKKPPTGAKPPTGGLKPATPKPTTPKLPQATGPRSSGQARAGGFALEQARKNATQNSLKSAKALPVAKGGRFAKLGGGRIPIIGPLITLIIRSVVYKEPLAKAATAAVGMGLGQVIGGFIGGLGAGALGLGTLGLGAVVAPLIVGAGSIIGGLVGEWLGAALYDVIASFSGKNKQGSRKASGGQVSAPKSSIKPGRRKVSSPKQRNKVTPQRTQPGKDIGGRYKIEEYFGRERIKPKDPTDTRTTGEVIVKQIEKASTEVKKLPLDWVASLGGAFIDMTMGQKPDRKVASDIAKSFGSYTDNLVNNEISFTTGQITKALVGMANGGSVPDSFDSEQRKSVSKNVEKNIEQRLQTIFDQAANATLKNIKAIKDVTEIREMQKRSLERQGGTGSGGGAGGGAGGGGGGGAGGYATGSENFVSSQEIYSYLKSKGLSHNHIMGMLANIQAESSFNSGAIGDSGTSGGLFQHHAERFDGMVAFAGKDWAKNWKRQVDYALREGAGQQYKNKEFKNAEEASAWFTLNFERPANKEYKARQRLGNLSNFGADGSWKGGAQPGVDARKNAREFNLKVKGGSKPSTAITSEYGMRLHPTLGYEKMHYGMDFAGGDFSEGKSISVIKPGKVVDINTDGSGGGYGNFVVVKHDDGTYSFYAHLDQVKVNKGDKLSISKGGLAPVIGTVGSTGMGTGPHLHFEVGTGWNNGTLTGRYDPSSVIDEYLRGGGKVTIEDIVTPKAKPSTGQYDIIIPLDHVPANLRNKVPDKRGGNTFKFASQTGADGRERQYTGQISSYMAEKLRKQGYRVRVITPEEFGNFEDYDNFIQAQSKKGTTVMPLHLDADPRKGGTGFLARIRKDDVDDQRFAEAVSPILKKYAEIFGAGQRYGGIDTQQNATIDKAASSPAALLELGSLVTLEKIYGKNFVNHPQYKKFMDELTDAITGTVSKKPTPIKKGTQAVLNKQPVTWDGKKWIPKEQYDTTKGWKSAAKRSAQIQADRPWWDKFGFFGGAARVQKKRAEKKSFELKNPGATLYNSPQGYTPYKTKFPRKQGGGSVNISPNQSTSSYSSLNRSGSLQTETSYNEQMVVMVQREIIMT